MQYGDGNALEMQEKTSEPTAGERLEQKTAPEKVITGTVACY